MSIGLPGPGEHKLVPLHWRRTYLASTSHASANGLLIRSDKNGWHLLDYGEMPFTGPTDYFSHPGPGYCDGLAWDGQNLWALDARNKRICSMVRS